LIKAQRKINISLVSLVRFLTSSSVLVTSTLEGISGERLGLKPSLEKKKKKKKKKFNNFFIIFFNYLKLIMII
jgi:hypothetical protein